MTRVGNKTYTFNISAVWCNQIRERDNHITERIIRCRMVTYIAKLNSHILTNDFIFIQNSYIRHDINVLR